MILTDKAKIEFLEYYKKRDKIKVYDIGNVEIIFNIQDNTYKNSLLIEWFDTKNIIILIDFDFKDEETECFNYKINLTKDVIFSIHKNLYFDTRQEAKTKAIEKANEIFNNI